MSKLITAVFLALSLTFAVDGATGATYNLAGTSAPAFDLPAVTGGGYLDSQDVFSTHPHTLLVFWDSSCPHCVESLAACEDFVHTLSPGSLGALGVHTDSEDLFGARRAAESAGVTFAQVWDPGNQTRVRYGIELATFSVFLIDRDGVIVAGAVDPDGDAFPLLQSMWEQAMTASTPTPAPRAQPSPGGLTLQADARIRFLGIDSRGSAAAGPYGEEVRPGNNLHFRFELEMTRRIGRRLMAGGLLRISNEDESVLDAGPKYLGSQWGSVFAEIFADALSVRLGYYEVAMTPLTLMRWDWDDNPRIGGTAGCGCAAAAGVLLVESLEELSSELVFEGAVAEVQARGVRTRAFYAIPRRPGENTFLTVRSTGAERARYSLELAGVESAWQRSDDRTGSVWQLGVRAVASWENRRSVDFELLGYPVPDPWTRSAIVTADWSLPVVRSLDVVGEWILWNEATTEGLAPLGGDDQATAQGKGGIAGVVLTAPGAWRLRGDYLRLDSEFYSPFAALSYAPNRHGARASVEIPTLGGDVVGSMFYKRLEEIDGPEPGGEKAWESQFGVSLDVSLPSGWGGSVGWLDNGAWRNGSVDPFDETRRAVVAAVRWDLTDRGTLELQYQRVDSELHRMGTSDDALANLYSVYLRTRL